jgi:hypothetical protein
MQLVPRRTHFATQAIKVDYDDAGVPRMTFQAKVRCREDLINGSAYATTKNPENDYEIIMDCGSTDHIFRNGNLFDVLFELNNAVSIGGINDRHPIEIDRVGEWDGIQNILYTPDIAVNLVSQGRLRLQNLFYFDNEADTYIVTPKSGKALYFFPKNLLYICNINYVHKVYNLSVITKRDEEQANKAKLLIKRLGYITPEMTKYMISNGMILDSDVTCKDIDFAYEKFGPDIEAIRGKSQNRKAPAVLVPDTVHDGGNVKVSMAIDLVFGDGMPFLISKTKPIDYVMINHLSDRTKKQVEIALLNQVNKYKEKNISVTYILSDGEKAVTALASETPLIGTRFNICGADEHVPAIEGTNRGLKMIARSIVMGLNFKLPRRLLPFLYVAAANLMNWRPSKNFTIITSPAEIFLNRKYSIKLDGKGSFGDYVEIYIPYVTSNNVRESRTEPAILLHSVGNLQGGFNVWLLNSNTVAVRNKWNDKVKINDIIINQIELLAKENFVSEEDIQFTPDDIDYYYSNDTNVEELNTEQLGIEESELTVTNPEDEVDLVDVIVPELPVSPETVEENPLSFEDSPGDILGPGEIATTDDAPDILFENPQFEMTAEKPTRVQPPRAVKHPPGFWSNANYGHAYRISLESALLSHGKWARDSIMDELKVMIEREVFEPVNILNLSPKEMKSRIPSMLFCKEKKDAMGNIIKFKSRFTAGGHRQNPDNYLHEETSSYTPATSSIFVVAAISAFEKRKVKTLDFTAAYLNALMKKKVFMKINKTISNFLIDIKGDWKTFLDDRGELTVILKKALYGCLESAVLWYDRLVNFMLDLGFKVSGYDKCVLFKIFDDDSHMLVIIYVDDLFMSCINESHIDNLIDLIRKEFKEVTTNDDKVFTYLGMLFDFSHDGKVQISMPSYTKELLDDLDVQGTKPTPANDKLNSEDDTKLLCEDEQKSYHSIIAKLLFMAKRTRPDILFFISFAATRVNKATEKDRNDLQRALMYLNGTADLGLVFEEPNYTSPEVQAYADASFNCHLDSKSHTGVCIMLGSACVHAVSTKQKIVTRSTPESELVAADAGAAAALAIGNFILSIGYQLTPPVLYQDATSAIAMIKEGGPKSFRTRHIALKFFFISDRVKSGELVVEYVMTSLMIADLLTKPLQGAQFTALRHLLMNCDRFTVQLRDW